MSNQPCIAVVGASVDRTKFGNKCVRAFVRAGWQVFPVHPKASTIEGLTVFQNLAEVPPVHLDRVSVYLPAEVTMNALDQWTSRPIGELWLNPGADSPQVVAKARQLGFNVICACSIVAIGASPYEFE